MRFGSFAPFAWQLTLLTQVTVVLAYNLLEDFSGDTFFDKWDFYGNYDNLTLGTHRSALVVLSG